MRTASRSIVLLAGLAASAGKSVAAEPILPEAPGIGVHTHEGPHSLAGHLYINAGTGESVFTPAEEYFANRAARSFRALGNDINGDGRADVWINTNTDPCPIGTPSNPYIELGTLDTPTTQGDHHLFKCQIAGGGSDLLVEHVSFTFWTDLEDTDTNSDTVPDGNTAGAGIEISFWDREDFWGKTSCFCPCAGGPGLTRIHINTLSVTDLPGTLTPGVLAGTVVTLELGPDQVFEIADTDGVGPSNGNFNPFVAADLCHYPSTTEGCQGPPDGIPDADTDQNGTMDWSHSFLGIQPSDGRVATIAYTLAAPGVLGTPGVIADDPIPGVVNVISGPYGADDGVIDYGNRTDGTPPLQWSHTRILISSILPAMGRSGLPFTSSLLPVPSMVGRFSMFFASLEQQPDPLGPMSSILCCDPPGLPNSDLFGWGSVHPPNGTFYGDLNCEIDDDGDTVPDGRPWSAPFMALSGGGTVVKCSFADCNCEHALNIDDVECFVEAYLGNSLHSADCDGNGALNVNDIDCFVASFIGGCP